MILFEIFWVFFKISLISLGGVFGVLPELERMVVVDNHWMTHEFFIQTYVFGQFVPGPNMAMCPLIGYSVAGWPGWVAAFLGIYLGPILVMGLTFVLYTRYRNLDWVHRCETALRPLVFGLLLGTTLQLLWSQTLGSRLGGILLCTAGFYIYRKKWLGPLSLIFASGAVWWLMSSIQI